MSFAHPIRAAFMLLAAAGVASAQDARAPQEIAAAARQATVQIRALDARGSSLGSGTGFFATSDGLIITNFHVIAGAESLQIETLGGEIFDNVFYVTSDPRRDVAILKIPVEGATPLRLAANAEAEVGSRVYVMGNPLGQTGTFSDGMVSAQRAIEGVSMLQITAPISPGSSGGPVMDARGDVLGVATMILTGGQNLNYAVPIRYVRPLISTGERPERFRSTLLPAADGGLADVGRAPQGSRSASPPRRPPASPLADEWEQEVHRQLAVAEEAFSQNNMAPSHEVVTGRLREWASEEFTIRLRAGVLYGIVGVCDQDCHDLDLRLYSATGRLLESDLRVSDLPLIGYEPRVSGTYTIRVTMSGCEASPCRYGVRAFAALPQ